MVAVGQVSCDEDCFIVLLKIKFYVLEKENTSNNKFKKYKQIKLNYMLSCLP